MRTYLLGSFGSVSLEEDTSSSWALPSCSEMVSLDRFAIDRHGITGCELMERAGTAVASEIASMLGALTGPVLILCGPGNNGGDGLVIARKLSAAGKRVVALVAWAEQYSEEFLAQLVDCPVARIIAPLSAALKDIRGQTLEVQKGDIQGLFSEAVLVVDALLGTGQREAPRAGIRELVDKLVQERKARPELQVVAVDIPTGVDGDTGAIYEPHITADRTVAIELIKRGCLQFPARAACGDLVARPIGISSRMNVEFSCAEGAMLPSFSPREPDVHKGMLPRVLVVGGSRSMPGAPILSSLGALYCGAGLVTRVVRESWTLGVAGAVPECINLVLPGHADGVVPEDVAVLCAAAENTDVVVIGPGLGTAPQTFDFLTTFLDRLRKNTRIKVVLDADALNYLAQSKGGLDGLQAVLTPHPGEAARLLGESAEILQRDRFSAARRLAAQYGCVVLLKGAGTIVHDGVNGIVIARGTPYLATPGSGDVLAGIIAACVPRVESLRDAAVCGAYIHARAGEEASQRNNGPVIASEVARAAASIVSQFG